MRIQTPPPIILMLLVACLLLEVTHSTKAEESTPGLRAIGQQRKFNGRKLSESVSYENRARFSYFFPASNVFPPVPSASIVDPVVKNTQIFYRRVYADDYSVSYLDSSTTLIDGTIVVNTFSDTSGTRHVLSFDATITGVFGGDAPDKDEAFETIEKIDRNDYLVNFVRLASALFQNVESVIVEYNPTPTPCDFSQYYTGDLDAIVVGAGMSGLAAAATLLQRGKNVLVLEGRPEVGGRMRTKTNFGVPAGDYYRGDIELGANWIYGGYGKVDEYDDPNLYPTNPIKNLALDAGVDFMQEVFNSRGIDIYDLTRPGSTANKRLNFTEVRDKLVGIRTASRCVSNNAVDLLFTQLGNNPEAALGSETVRELLEACGWTASDAIDNLLEVTYYDNEALAPLEETSVLSFVPWGYEDYGAQVNFVKGQNGGLTEVARKYAENNGVLSRTVFNARVKRIDYLSNPARVFVELDGSNNQCYVDASKVISTVSQGVVNKLKDTLFFPPITNTDINQVELRTWVKLFFQFPVAFWNGIPRPGARMPSQFNYIFTAEADNRKGCNTWMNLDYETDLRDIGDPAANILMPGSRILMGWVPQHIMDEFGGEENYVFKDDDFSPGGDVERILQPLKDAFPDTFVMPNAAFASSWLNDEWTYGSWNSFRDDESLDNNDYYEFYNPRNDGTFWLSGASSCRRHYRNMQGAYFAGVRDGNWVADTLDNADGSLTPRPESDCDIYEFPLPGSTMATTGVAAERMMDP